MVIVSAPKGSLLEAVENEDGGSVLTMTSPNEEQINVFYVDPQKKKVVQHKPQ